MSNRAAANKAAEMNLELMGSQIREIMVPVAINALYMIILTRNTAHNEFKASNPIIVAWNGFRNRPAGTPIVGVDNIYFMMLIILAFAMVTGLVILLLYLRWHRFLVYYFYVPTLIIMLVLTPVYIFISLSDRGLGLDIITMALIAWNMSALGMMAIFKVYAATSLRVQQAYLIHNSTILAFFILESLPNWTPWALLLFLVVYDFLSVLAPFGPLRLIVDMAEREGIDNMPGLVYSTRSLDDRTSGSPDERKLTSSDTRKQNVETHEEGSAKSKRARKGHLIRKRNVENSHNQGERENHEPGSGSTQKQPQDMIDSLAGTGSSSEPSVQSTRTHIRMGLGDFVFYGLLVGLTCSGAGHTDATVTLAALVAILFGVVVTVSLLVTREEAVPALPVSVGLGLLLVPLTMKYGADLSKRLSVEQIFV